MKKYFYSVGIEKEGPFTLEELKQKNIEPKWLIWHEGLDDWKTADNIDELGEIFELTPPPLDLINDNSTTKTIQDTSESKNISRKKQSMFSNSFLFDGRIRRLEYGISLIIYLVLFVFVDAIVKSRKFPIGFSMANVPLYWFMAAQGVKRCHDLGKNGWWQLIPFYVFWMIFQNGDSGINDYGKNPKV
jgi:uncharacterized membrane protein YhaH (DUF805 family)